MSAMYADICHVLLTQKYFKGALAIIGFALLVKLIKHNEVSDKP